MNMLARSLGSSLLLPAVLGKGGAAAGGTSATRYSFAGTGFRQAIGSNPTTINTSTLYQCYDTYFYTGDWPLVDPAFFFPCFHSYPDGRTNHEVATTGSMTFEGFAFEWSGTFNAATPSSSTLDPATDGLGKWIAFTGVTLPANTRICLRTAAVLPNTAGLTYPAGSYAVPGAASQASATTLSAKLTGGTLNNSGNRVVVRPVAMMGKGGDGRPCVLVIGDSKGVGADQAAVGALYDARFESGYVSRGLDSNVRAKRVPFVNMCVNGTSIATYATSGQISGKLAMLTKALEFTGGVVPCDWLLSQHGTNSVNGTATTASMLADYRSMYTLWKSTLGAPSMPVAQLEMTCYPSGTTDAYSSLAGQTFRAGGVDQYPSGVRWTVNAAIGGADGLGDPTATLRADGSIQASAAPWRYGAADTGSNRDKWKVLSFNTTVATAYASGNSLVLTDSPAVGDYLCLTRDDGNFSYGLVTAVTGTGPYTATMSWQGGTGAAAVGKLVRATMAGFGLHEGPYAHGLEAEAVIDLKVAMGLGL